MNLTYPVATDTDFPDGLCCSHCGRDIADGQPYSEAPEGMIEDDVVVTLVCVYC